MGVIPMSEGGIGLLILATEDGLERYSGYYD